MNLNERIRRLQEEEKQKIADQQKQLMFRQQEEQLRLQKEEEARNAAERQKSEARARIFGIFDRLEVRQNLEGIKHQVWENKGLVLEQQSDSTRTVRLYFEYQTKIPEIVRTEWEERRMESYNGLDGTSREGFVSVPKHREDVAAWHKVIKSSYLEIGVDVAGLDSKWAPPADLYVLDTDVDVYDFGSLQDLDEQIEERKEGHLKDMDRNVGYKDKSGKHFYKNPHNTKGGNIGDKFRKVYSLETYFRASGSAFELTSSTSDELVSEFLEISLALSCAKRISQNKLPLQLK